MVNKIPIIGWLLSAIAAVSLSVPFYICWTACGLGAAYFGFLPERWQSLPFWDCVGLFIVIAIVKGTLTPKFVHVSQSNTNNKE